MLLGSGKGIKKVKTVNLGTYLPTWVTRRIKYICCYMIVMLTIFVHYVKVGIANKMFLFDSKSYIKVLLRENNIIRVSIYNFPLRKQIVFDNMMVQ